MKTISKSETRKVILSELQEGYFIISEYDSYAINGRRKWSKTLIALSPDELRKILASITEPTL